VKRRSAALCLVVLLASAAPVLAQRSAKEAPPDRRPAVIADIVAGARAAAGQGSNAIHASNRPGQSPAHRRVPHGGSFRARRIRHSVEGTRGVACR
jgi:hypothetical protein